MIATAKKNGTKAYFYEQEEPFTRPILESVKISGEYLQKLKANEPQLRVESAREVADLIGGGLIPLSPGVLNHHVEINKAKGAPTEWTAPDPMISWIGALALARNAPHPAASLLWIDWLVSEEGQQGFAEIEYIPDPEICKLRVLDADMYTHAHVVCLEERRSARLVKAFLAIVADLQREKGRPDRPRRTHARAPR